MPVHEIHRSVEIRLGRSVRYAFLKNCLHEHARGQSPGLVRERWGWYRPI
jgi:hypothetical protein